jgi:hypothetical protein
MEDEGVEVVAREIVMSHDDQVETMTIHKYNQKKRKR